MALPQVRTRRRLNFAAPHLRQHLGRSRRRACAHGRDAGQPLRCNLRSAHGPWLGRPAEPRRAMGACWSARSARKRPAPRSRCRHAVRCAPSAGSCDRAAGRARPPVDRRRPARDATPAPPPGPGTASRPCARRSRPACSSGRGAGETCAWSASASHLHVVGRVERNLPGDRAHRPLHHSPALGFVVGVLFDRLEFVDRLARLWRYLLMLGQLGLPSDAGVCRVLDRRRCRRRHDGVGPVAFRRGLETFRPGRDVAAGQRRRREDPRFQLRHPHSSAPSSRGSAGSRKPARVRRHSGAASPRPASAMAARSLAVTPSSARARG